MTPNEMRERRKFLPLDDEEVADSLRLHRQLHAWLEGRRWRWAVGSVVLVVVLGVLAVVSVGVVRNTGRIQQGQFAACREGNIAPAYVRLAVSRYLPRSAQRDAARKLPILACYKTQRAGKPVRLSGAAERAYLRIYAKGRLPVVNRDGQVVGSEPLPARSR